MLEEKRSLCGDFFLFLSTYKNLNSVNFIERSSLHHQPLLVDAPRLLGYDVAEFGERRLGSDVVAGDDPRVQEGLAGGVQPAHAARDALRRAHDDHAALRSILDQRQDVGAVTAARVLEAFES